MHHTMCYVNIISGYLDLSLNNIDVPDVIHMQQAFSYGLTVRQRRVHESFLYMLGWGGCLCFFLSKSAFPSLNEPLLFKCSQFSANILKTFMNYLEWSCVQILNIICNVNILCFLSTFLLFYLPQIGSVSIPASDFSSSSLSYRYDLYLSKEYDLSPQASRLNVVYTQEEVYTMQQGVQSTAVLIRKHHQELNTNQLIFHMII